MEDLFFSDGKHLLKVVIATITSYFALMFIIRIMGKRTLAKMNAFDFVVTVTLGSTLSSMLLNKVPVVDGAVAVLLIISLQYLIAYLAQQSEKIEKFINHSPTLLYYDGKFMKKAMKRERITEEEIIAEIRSYRLEQLSEVRAVVMEINGTFSVIKKDIGVPPTTLDEFNRV